MNIDGSDHYTNNYSKLHNFIHSNLENTYMDSWFGIEQEYIILDKFGNAFEIYNICNDKIQYPLSDG